MIKFLAVLMALLPALCGCKSIREEQFARDDQFCKQIGAAGPAYTQCMMQRDQQRSNEANNDAARVALYQQMWQQNQPRQTNCIRTSDITASCTTY